MEINKIYNESCLETMAKMPDNLIDLTVTSPPYNCGKKYSVVSDNLPFDQYWNMVEDWLQELYRATKSGGRLAVNLPWWMGKKPRKDVVYKFKTIAMHKGWLFLDKIIWIKGDSNNVHTSGGYGGNGSGWGTYMSPSGPAIRCASEPILIFAKESRGRKVISGKGNGDCVKGDMTQDEWMAWTLDVWFLRGESNKAHPAVFPEEIAYRLIKLYSYQNDLVYDPFIGSGTTAKMAMLNNRNYIGSEISKEYCEIAEQRLKMCGGLFSNSFQTKLSNEAGT